MLQRLLLVSALLVAGATSAAPDQPTPRRIVSLAPSITETLFVLGVGDRVVGVTRFCNYPPGALERTKVGGLIDVDVEAVLALHPDLVVAEEQQKAVSRLRELGVEVLTVKAQSKEELPQAFRSIGVRVGREVEAASLIDSIETRFRRVSDALEGKPRPSVLLVVGRTPLVAAGRGTFLDALLTAAGGSNIVGDSERPYPLVSMEDVLIKQPDIIIECSGSMAGKDTSVEVREAWSRWGTLPAVRAGRVYVSQSDALLRPGPRVADALDELLELLHPAIARELRGKPPSQ